jgi:hypothetical protein
VEQILSVCLQDENKTDSDETVTNRTSVFAEKLCIGIIIVIIIIIIVITAHESLNWWGWGLILTGRHFFLFFVTMELPLVKLDIRLRHTMPSIHT